MPPELVLTAVGGTLDAGLIATRATHAILVKNVTGSLAKIAALCLLTSLRSSGLLIAFGTGLALTTLLAAQVGVRSARETTALYEKLVADAPSNNR